MATKSAVVWTRALGAPQKLANITVLDDRVIVDGIPELAQEQSPLSLVWPWADVQRGTFYLRTANMLLPPFMMRHLPPMHRSGRQNLQRSQLEQMIAQYASPPPPGFDSEWEMLMLGGRNGIGHLDFFRHDDEAQSWYASLAAEPTWSHGGAGLWQAVRQHLRQSLPEDETEIDINTLIGPTPSVGGMIPKLLVAIPEPGQSWGGEVSATNLLDGIPGVVHAIVKLETDDYPGIVALEGLCLDIHHEAKLDVPRHWPYETDEGMRVLAIERFDRNNGKPVLLESAFSVLHLAANLVSPTSGSIDQLGQALFDPTLMLSHDRGTDAEDVFRRVVLALLTGNGDLHWENWSFREMNGRRGLSPVYDPAPMRAYAQHNMVMVLGFAGLTNTQQPIVPAEIGGRLLKMAERALRITPERSRHIVDGLLAVTESYPDRVADLVDVGKVPENIGDYLRGHLGAVRTRIETAIHAPVRDAANQGPDF